MAVTYTVQVKATGLATRRRVADFLVNLIQHQEALDSWMTKFEVTPADGTISITMTKPIPARRLGYLGLNNDGVET